MQDFQLKTSAGRFRFVGRLENDPTRPALLAVTGAFPRPTMFQDLVGRYPQADVLAAYLPGMIPGLPWSPAGVDELTEGLEATAQDLFGSRPLVVVGASLGGLLALGLHTPGVVRKVVVEPFFATRDLWPFIAYARELMAGMPGNVPLATALWTLFGVSPTDLEDRDYRALLARNITPADVIVGGDPLLPERPLPAWPSFTSAEDRALLAASPRVRLHDAGPGTGHALQEHVVGGPLLQALIRAAMDEAAAAAGRGT